MLGRWKRKLRRAGQSAYIAAVARRQAGLQRVYDAFVRIHDPARLAAAEAILARIGTVDAAGEGYEDAALQRDLSVRFHWGHDHRFDERLHVRGRMGVRHVNLVAQFAVRYGLADDHFRGKSVIDVGVWTGGTTLMLKALGAGPILALEEVQKYARAARDLIEGVYGIADVTCDGTNLYDLETGAGYDIAWFPGVVYHLSDPVLGLRRLFNALRDGGEIFAESAGIDSAQPICRYEGNRIFHRDTSPASAGSRGGWNWFLPSPSCLERWMIEAGFEEVDCFYSRATDRVFGHGRRRHFNAITRAGFSRRDIA